MINIDLQYDADFINTDKITQLAQHICSIFYHEDITVNIRIVDNNTILQANKDFLDHDYVTDVISFDMSDDTEKCFDIIVNAELAINNAQKLNIAPLSELSLYICHGMLHNFGFDDADPKKAEKMHKKEDEILHALGYGYVYNIDKPDI